MSSVLSIPKFVRDRYHELTNFGIGTLERHFSMPIEMDFPLSEWLRARSAASRAANRPYVIGVAGSVAAGKSTFAHALREVISAWPEQPKVESVATDGFLFPNRILAEREITMRKGFPESYDVAALRQAITAIKR